MIAVKREFDGLSQGIAAEMIGQHRSPGQRLEEGPMQSDGSGQRQHQNDFGQSRQHAGDITTPAAVVKEEVQLAQIFRD